MQDRRQVRRRIIRFEASDLGAIAIKEAVKRSGVAIKDIEEVIMGNGWQAGVGANPARIAMFKAGLPQKIPAFTVNIRCGSGIRTIMLGADRIRLGDAKVIVGGGMESASNVPYILPEARWGMRMGDKKALDVLQKDGFLCPLAGMLMGEATESLAEEFHITREEQDEFSLNSHRKACKATEEGRLRMRSFLCLIRTGRREIVIDKDEIPGLTRAWKHWPNSRPSLKKEGPSLPFEFRFVRCGSASL